MSALIRSGYLLLYSILFFCSPTSVLSARFFNYSCPKSTTYAPNSKYRSNLNQLLSTLKSNANSADGFFNYTIGHGSLDTIYGLFLCRGDVNTKACEECVVYATSHVLQCCPREKVATIWYDQCMLRYSSQYIFSRVDLFDYIIVNQQNISRDPDGYNSILAETMTEIVVKATKKYLGKRFATKEARLIESERLYTLAQCTPDLSSEDCGTCLEKLRSQLPNCCVYKMGATFFSSTCHMRFELYPFYNIKLGNGGAKRPVIIAIVVISSVLLLVGLCLLTRRRLKRKHYGSLKEGNELREILTAETLQYDLKTVQLSTNSFSLENKIGEGGFGDVYKGTFPNGQEIAVKRLSMNSRQGAQEFMNEVVLVAKLQHGNLVRLLGFCLEREERILIYEFVANKSLDYFIFKNQQMLEWPNRYKIIEGIARGMLYLHRDSRLKIIHRDLKASNILLDRDMNPKISDFGMARIFDVDKSQDNTLRVVGTYGYMAPEYAMHGQFSIKSDVFSFGILILEIINGKKNNSIHQSDGRGGLINYAWKLWRDNTPMELMDPTLQASYVLEEVARCIHVGLLCVQEDVNKRPTMSSILSTLESYSTSLPFPQQPAFYKLTRLDSTTEEREYPNQPLFISINEASLSETCPR